MNSTSLTSGSDVVKIAEVFLKAPCFALSFGAFAKLYENDGQLATHAHSILSKLLDLCTTLHNSRKTTASLLNRAEIEGGHSLRNILTCFVCNNLYHHPIVLFCGHSFCRKCLCSNLSCQSCTSSTAGQLSDSVLINKAVQHFFPKTVALFHKLDESAALIKEGRYSEAFAIHDELLGEYPTDYRCLQAKADSYFLTSDYRSALNLLDHSLSLYPDWPKFHCLRGRTLIRLNRRREALEHFFKCFTIYPDAECLRKEISQALDEVITPADISNWKRIVELCLNSSSTILEVLTELPEDLRASVSIAPWMHFPPTSAPERFDTSPLYRLPCSVPLESADTESDHADSVASIRADFNCALCLRLLLYPTSLPCGHTFCRDCIEHSLDYRNKCPLCKADLSLYTSSSSRAHCVTLWKLVRYLFRVECEERQKAQEHEAQSLARVGLDPDLELPAMVCCLAFPGMPCPLHIFEPQYRNMVRRSMNSGSRRFGIFVEGSGPCGLAEVGVILRINTCDPLPDGRMLIDTRGCSRIRVLSGRKESGLTTIRFTFYHDLPVRSENLESYRAMCTEVHSMASNWLSTLPCSTRASLVPFFGGLPSIDSPSPEPDGPGAWVWWLIAVLPLADACRYKLLSCREPEIRMELIKGIFTRLASDQWKRPRGGTSGGICC